MSRRRSSSPVLLTALAVLSLAACTDDGPGTSITVQASPGTCDLSRATAVGPVLFSVINIGEVVMRVSLHDSGARVVVEADGIGPAMTQTMAANVYDGEYELVCQPVQGEASRAQLTVG